MRKYFISNSGNSNHPWWIAAVLFLTALTFVFNLWGTTEAIKKNETVDPLFVAVDTVRDPLLEPMTHQAGFTYNCNNCHKHIEATAGKDKLIAAHKDITLEHGINARCYNCHDRGNRERLVDINGKQILFSKSELLCRKCHGPKYRDWALGVHGRPNGYWDRTKGESVKSTCVACHNPHSPQFKAIKPAPAPKESFHQTDEEFWHE